MSRKYYERLVTSSGVTSKKFESNLGAKILGKFGWKTGDGLGAEGQGMTDCLQVKRREENEGLGRELEKKESSEWENWWADSYNAIAKKLAVSVATTSSGSEDSSDDSSEDEGEARTTAIKRADMQKGKLRRIMRQERAAAKEEEEADKKKDKHKSKKHHREETKIRKSKRAAVEEEEVPKKKHKKSKKSKRSAEE
ncbi:G patch domain containing protein, putative [Perkinsus marinus ATCC 50983]|uniref:G patch domain containing protein, putative n=1 Tax=Perkinsus marinus (strain ATCC 50983 / TXsc) TaxID=423536 RepID=C5K4V2_PERM5|nr:G patch domain containing protein, putative [Perkinsus marinus ATCC 50983]EER20374.1 G patch domain containing protein, putative [Perkinsus marinus ATCC 50983]|eukprot:XP_002788578.1 G patch domain containing protein, putative [Perkinsus marinus ATCC 50983]